MAEIQKSSKLINFNNLIFYFKGKNGPKNFIDFTGPLGLINNIKNGYIKIEKKEKENQKEFKTDLNEITEGKWEHKSKEQKNVTENIKMLCEEREKVIKFYNDYFLMVSVAKYKSIHGEGLKMLTPKQMIQRLPIALAQVKASNKPESLLTEIRQIVYSLYQTIKFTKKVYNNIMKSIKS